MTMAAAAAMSTATTGCMGTKLIHTAIHRRSYQSLLRLCPQHYHCGRHQPTQQQQQRQLHLRFQPAVAVAPALPFSLSLSSSLPNHHQLSLFRRGYVNTTSSDTIANPSTNPFRVSNSLNSIAAAETNSSSENSDNESTTPIISTGAGSKSNVNGDLMDTYAVAIISASDNDGNMKLTTKNLSIQQIVKEVIPGMHPRDFFSLALTSLGDAERKRRILMKTHYSVKNSINPWFILPRETEIIMSFGCVRAIIGRKSAFIFDAHKPTIKQQSLRISKQLMRKDSFVFRNGEIIFHHGGTKSKSTNFEIDVVEEIVREVCTMYSRRIHLYEPIVNSLMDRVTNEVFSPSGLHRLVPVKDSLQHFEMNVKGALRCITNLLSSDEDMVGLLLTEKAIAKAENRTVPMEMHGNVELLLEEYARQLNSILLEIDYLLQRVQSKQDMVALSLDAYRNRMIRMNLYLTVGGISLAFGTAVAGFFGMNVPNGYERVEGIFELVVLSSCLLGGGFLGGCYSYLNGLRSRRRTLDHLSQIEIMSRALGDMSALDYSFELMLKSKEPVTKARFREHIYASEPECIRDEEVDFLFGLLDYSKNEVIDKDDFPNK